MKIDIFNTPVYAQSLMVSIFLIETFSLGVRMLNAAQA